MYGFKGTTTDFFRNRFGIQIDPKYNKKINHTLSTSYTKKVAAIYKDQILHKAKEMRQNYLKYLRKNISKSSLLVDLGYHSTTQINISKLLKWDIPGAYFLTTGKKNKNIYSCFGELFKFSSFSITNKTFKNLNILYFIRTVETVLSAPHGQLISMGKNGKPIFGNDITINEKIKKSKIVTDASWEFINDFLNICPISIDKINLNAKQIYKNFVIFNRLLSHKKISKSLYETFVEENEMCGLDKHYMFKI